MTVHRQQLLDALSFAVEVMGDRETQAGSPSWGSLVWWLWGLSFSRT